MLGLTCKDAAILEINKRTMKTPGESVVGRRLFFFLPVQKKKKKKKKKKKYSRRIFDSRSGNRKYNVF